MISTFLIFLFLSSVSSVYGIYNVSVVYGISNISGISKECELHIQYHIDECVVELKWTSILTGFVHGLILIIIMELIKWISNLYSKLRSK